MNRRIGVVATLVLSALAFTGGAMLYSGTAEGEPTKKVVAGPVDSLIRPHSPIIGPKNAPVTIVEFFDPSCEACRAFYPTVKGIVAKYPKDVRLVMRYLPLHPGSAEAIVILEAARVQGKLEPVTAALLEAQPDWHDGKMDGAWVAAEKAGLDVAKARAIEDISVFYRIGDELARSGKWPGWKAGSEFKAVRDASAAARN